MTGEPVRCSAAQRHPGRLNEVRELIALLMRRADFPLALRLSTADCAALVLAKLPEHLHGDYLGRIITTVAAPDLLRIVSRLDACHAACDAICFLRKGAAVSLAVQMMRDAAD
jgi:hypothetical protein